MSPLGAGQTGRLDTPTSLGPGGRLTGPPPLGAARGRSLAWLLRALLVAGFLLGFIAAILNLPTRSNTPDRLAEAVLAGARGPQCVRLVIAPDRSGSMEDYAPARDAALAALFPWSAGQLRANDQIAVIEWAGDARTTLQPTPVGEAALGSSTGLLADDTHLQPVIAQAADLLATRCRTHLILISDGLADDLAAAGNLDVLAAAGIDQISLLMPSENLQAPQEFIQAFPYATSTSFDGTNPDDTALALAQATADTTGQTVQRQ